ncbi:MAG: toprim domain-containing protein [Chloroflexi bacterium]|nr:toprim domain-containing protein [Chloroflexota bacterium]
MLRRIDIDALKRSRPIADVVASYGIELRASGRTLVGRCPFHTDGGRPNLYLYPTTESFYCFRCGVGGDAVTFVERIEGVGFLEAIRRLLGGRPCIAEPRRLVRPTARRHEGRTPWAPEEWACLAAAVELYHNRLLSDSHALAYVERRGLRRETLERCRVGYAAGDELVSYLRWRGVPIQAALRIGILRRGGDELMAGRIVVPEIRDRRPVWLIGREVDDGAGPKYLGLPGSRRLLGWEAASRERSVCVVEGVFDWLTLQQWGVPSLALLGTHVRPGMVEALRHYERIYLVLDNDSAGREATGRLLTALGPVAVPVCLAGVKDVADLATHADGAALLGRAVEEATQAVAA